MNVLYPESNDPFKIPDEIARVFFTGSKNEFCRTEMIVYLCRNNSIVYVENNMYPLSAGAFGAVFL
ncbi:MAG: hypothetical protein LBT78_05535, partial [Tannerella sp.]|nr:hypothetical protein [Tannerella sp.]